MTAISRRAPLRHFPNWHRQSYHYSELRDPPRGEAALLGWHSAINEACVKAEQTEPTYLLRRRRFLLASGVLVGVLTVPPKKGIESGEAANDHSQIALPVCTKARLNARVIDIAVPPTKAP